MERRVQSLWVVQHNPYIQQNTIDLECNVLVEFLGQLFDNTLFAISGITYINFMFKYCFISIKYLNI